MAADRLTTSLQENIITLLCYSDDAGKVIVNLIEPALFEGEYRVIAERALKYWRQEKSAPKGHTADLVGEILDDTGNRKGKTYERILRSMHELAESINAPWVLSQLHTFVRMQRMKDAIVKSAERINSEQELAVAEIETIWHDLLRAQHIGFSPGLRLNSIAELFEYLEATSLEFQTGIAILDQRRIVPQRGTMMMFEAAAGYGKSWFLVNVGTVNYRQRKKVLHLSLENSEEETLLRYIQRMMSITKRATEGVPITEFVWREGRFDDSYRELVGFKHRDAHPKHSFEDKHARLEIESHVNWYGTRVDNLIIKRFPMGSLTPNGLRAYLDSLEASENFVPDMILIDYPKLMKVDMRNPRISIGQNIEECNAIAVERNVAVVAVHQLSKEGARAAVADATHTSEDWSIVGTCDTILVYSRTDAEGEHNLARLLVAKARREKDKWIALITQAYEMGQFCLDSTIMRSKHYALIRELTGEDEDDGTDEEEAD